MNIEQLKHVKQPSTKTINRNSDTENIAMTLFDHLALLTIVAIPHTRIKITPSQVENKY